MKITSSSTQRESGALDAHGANIIGAVIAACITEKQICAEANSVATKAAGAARPPMQRERKVRNEMRQELQRQLEQPFPATGLFHVIYKFAKLQDCRRAPVTQGWLAAECRCAWPWIEARVPSCLTTQAGSFCYLARESRNGVTGSSATSRTAGAARRPSPSRRWRPFGWAAFPFRAGSDLLM